MIFGVFVHTVCFVLLCDIFTLVLVIFIFISILVILGCRRTYCSVQFVSLSVFFIYSWGERLYDNSLLIIAPNEAIL